MGEELNPFNSPDQSAVLEHQAADELEIPSPLNSQVNGPDFQNDLNCVDELHTVRVVNMLLSMQLVHLHSWYWGECLFEALANILNFICPPTSNVFGATKRLTGKQVRYYLVAHLAYNGNWNSTYENLFNTYCKKISLMRYLEEMIENNTFGDTIMLYTIQQKFSFNIKVITDTIDGNVCRMYEPFEKPLPICNGDIYLIFCGGNHYTAAIDWNLLPRNQKLPYAVYSKGSDLYKPRRVYETVEKRVMRMRALVTAHDIKMADNKGAKYILFQIFFPFYFKFSLIFSLYFFSTY
jgi:hypothetical protein